MRSIALQAFPVKKGKYMYHLGDNFIPVVPTTQPLHTEEHLFCGDPTYPCTENMDALTELDQAIKDGLITPDEATAFIQGRTV